MLKIALIFLFAAALLSLLFGVRYLRTKEFMPYHAVVSGKSWPQLDPGVQTIVLGMLRIVGGGLVTYGAALLWLLVPLHRAEAWAPWAVLTVSAATLLPTLYVTITLRKFQPIAKTPVVPTLFALALVLAGVGTWYLV